MNSNQELSNLKQSILLPLIFVVAICTVKLFEVIFNLPLNNFGIKPRELEGLIGIIFHSFLHKDLNHLWANSVAFLVLASFTNYFYKKVAYRVFLFSYLAEGILLWIVGRTGNHIGASGLVYAFASFLIFSGFISKYYRLVAVSLIVVFLYGSLIWGIFPIDPEVSWEGHLIGALCGLGLAYLYKKHAPKRTQFKWEEDRSGDEHYIKYSYKAPKPKRPTVVELIKRTRDKNLERRKQKSN